MNSKVDNIRVASTRGGVDGGAGDDDVPRSLGKSGCPLLPLAPTPVRPFRTTERDMRHQSSSSTRRRRRLHHHGGTRRLKIMLSSYSGNSLLLLLMIACYSKVTEHTIDSVLQTTCKSCFTAAAAAATPAENKILEDKNKIDIAVPLLHARTFQHRYDAYHERRAPPTSPPSELGYLDEGNVPKKPLPKPSAIEELSGEGERATDAHAASVTPPTKEGIATSNTNLRNAEAVSTQTTTYDKKSNTKPKSIPQHEKKHVEDEDVYEHNHPEKGGREAKDAVIKQKRQDQPAEDCKCNNVWKDGGSKLAYLIVAHNARTANDAVPLYQALRRPNTIILIHVDTKLDTEQFEQTSLYDEIVKKQCTCGSITQIHSIYDSQWGEWSMNDPTHWAMRHLVNERDAQFTFKDGTSWDVFLNLSGDTMPTLTQERMSGLFATQLKGYNFVTSSACDTGLVPTNVYTFPTYWHKRQQYMHHPEGSPTLTYMEIQTDTTDEQGKYVTQEFQKEITIFWGSQWMALTPEFVDYIVHGLARPDSLPSRFKSWLQDNGKSITDETFIPTLLMNVPHFASSIPHLSDEDGSLLLDTSDTKATTTNIKMFSIRYERMDEHGPSAFGWFPTEQRYDVPPDSKVDKPHIWGPYFLGIYDLGNIRRSGALFVRKVSRTVEPNLVNLLPVNALDELPSIEWPHELLISPKPDWESRVHQAKEKENERKRQELKETAHQHALLNKNGDLNTGDDYGDSDSNDADDAT